MSDELHLTDGDAEIEALLRSLANDDLELETPPSSIWSGIEAGLESETAFDTAPDAEEIDTEALAPVVSLAARRRPALLAAAVAAALVVVAGLAVVLTDSAPEPVEVASAELAYVDDPAAFVEEGIGRSADVTLLADGDTETVQVDAADLPVAPAGSDLEIWLIGLTDGDADIVSLGLVEDPADPGSFTVPADFDRSVYDAVAVDISIEPDDGDAAHSGMSLVRGVLTA